MSRILRAAAGLLITAILAVSLPGCGHPRIRDFKPAASRSEGVVFGFVKVSFDGKDRTRNTLLVFSNGESMRLGTSGLVAVRSSPGLKSLTIKKAVVPGASAPYGVYNLRLRAAPGGSRLYFGHLTLTVRSSRLKGTSSVIEDWGWQVRNDWRQAVAVWKKAFPADRAKFFAAIAEKTAPDTIQTRSIASDGQEVVPGF